MGRYLFLIYWVESTFVPVQAVKENEVQFHSFFTSALYGVNGQLHTPDRFTSKKESRHPLKSRLCRPTSQSGLFRRRNLLPLPEIKPRLFWRNIHVMSLFSSVLCFQAHVICVLSSKWEIMFHKQMVNKLLCSWFQTFAVLWMLYSFFWAIPRSINFMCRRFGTICSSS